MGISANQARFLSLTARQCDLEYRIQNICRRRMNLSNKLTDAATAYNNATSDRRLFLNNINANSSGTIGSTTHNNIADNNQYDYITAENLYDNGYYVVDDSGSIISAENGVAKKKTGNTQTYQTAKGGATNIGDWYNEGSLSYQVIQIPTMATAPTSLALPTGAGTVSGTASSTVVGAATPGTTYSNWSPTGTVSVNGTGLATQTFTRTGRTEVAAGTVNSTVSVSQMTNSNLGTATGTVNINGVNFNQYTYTDYAGRTVTKLAIGDIGNTAAEKNTQALAQLNALATSSSTINNNFILMTDVDMSTNGNWGIIDNFAGTFDGNLHTISGMTYNTASSATKVGFFGNIEAGASVSNLNINTANITVGAGSSGIGVLAGTNFGNVSNVHATSIDINVNGTPGAVADSAFTNGDDAIGGLIGGNSGSVDRVSATGRIDINAASANLDGVGSLIGVNGSTSSVVSKSMADVDIYTNAASLECVNTFLGCDAVAGTYENCYTTSMIYDLSGGARTGEGYQDQYFSGHSNSTLIDCYKVLSNGSYAYWNGSTTAPIASSSTSYDNSSSQWSNQTVNGAQVWNTSVTPPTLNFDAVNTEQGTFPQKTVTTWTETSTVTEQLAYNPDYISEEYATVTLSSEDLETNLRNGTYTLATDADMLTQDPVSIDGKNYELVDWRTVAVISDDLYEGNDAAAQTIYESTIAQVNSQDKLLQLEQTNIETEYTAVKSEKEAVKKVLDTNSQNSFKYFG